MASPIDVKDWQRLRIMHDQLLIFWAAIAPLEEGTPTPVGHVDPHDVLMVEAIAADIEAITGGSHPAGPAARYLCARMLPGFVDDEMGTPDRLEF